MPDAHYDDPRLARLYDVFDDDRADLQLYVGLAGELRAGRIIDLGCGTGTLALRLAELGHTVLGVDPARASLDVARAKPGAGQVTWLHGDATTLPRWQADLTTMTGNAAQAVLGDAWAPMLQGVRHALRPGGCFAFESRVPERRAWEAWTPEATRQRREVLGTGIVESWVEVTDVALPLVSYRGSYRFADGSVLTSDSTLQFRTIDELRSSVEAAGLVVVELLDAPDRPGLEHVLLTRRPR